MSGNNFLTQIGHCLDELVLSPGTSVCETHQTNQNGVIVGLSGGPDSVALLLAVRQWGLKADQPVAAAHLNHTLRGEAADADTVFCRNLCDSLNVPLFEHTADPRPVARRRGQGLEEAGRHLRRTFCEGLLAENPAYKWIATGHHRDDQIETVLMRLFRGTGPEGLRGIRPVNGAWLHPMLDLDRAQIVAFLEEQGQPWRTDASNLDGDNARARLRRELLPLLRSIFGPGCTEGPARLAELLDDDLTILEVLSDQWLAACSAPDGTLQISAVLALAPAAARRVIRTWLARAEAQNVERVHVENIRTWLNDGVSGSEINLPGGLRLSRDFDVLSLRGSKSPHPVLRNAGDFRIVVATDANLPAPAAVGMAEGAGDSKAESHWSITCPADILRGKLRIRNWRQGDRFQPFGLQGPDGSPGTKKLSDLLREHKIARNDRQDVLVVTDDDGILWIIGLARSERTRLLPSTAQTVTISVIKRI